MNLNRKAAGSLIRKSMAVIIVLASTSNAPLEAQPAKTPASAFAFIQSSMTDGSWTGQLQNCEDYSCTTTTDNRIFSVQSYGGSYCFIRFTLDGERPLSPLTRDINLTKNFTFGIAYHGSERGVGFLGPVIMGNGGILNAWETYTSSQETAERVIAAFNYLQTACKPASAW